MITGGEKAVRNGQRCEEIVKNLLLVKNYQKVHAKTLAEFNTCRVSLFPTPGRFASKCRVPLIAPYHQGKGRESEVDVVVTTSHEDTVLISIKSQIRDGSVEQKLEYEIQQLLATELPAAMLVMGPIKSRNEEGWTRHVLEEIWERTRHYGSGRTLLFRTVEKISRWIDAGLPVGGRGVPMSQVFAEFCDRVP